MIVVVIMVALLLRGYCRLDLMVLVMVIKLGDVTMLSSVSRTSLVYLYSYIDICLIVFFFITNDTARNIE